MKAFASKWGGALLFLTVSGVCIVQSLESCSNGMAPFLKAGFYWGGPIYLLSFVFCFVGCKANQRMVTRGLVGAAILMHAWVIIKGVQIFQRVNLQGFAPCHGRYLEDGLYGVTVYAYGPYYGILFFAGAALLLARWIGVKKTSETTVDGAA